MNEILDVFYVTLPVQKVVFLMKIVRKLCFLKIHVFAPLKY